MLVWFVHFLRIILQSDMKIHVFHPLYTVTLCFGKICTLGNGVEARPLVVSMKHLTLNGDFQAPAAQGQLKIRSFQKKVLY